MSSLGEPLGYLMTGRKSLASSLGISLGSENRQSIGLRARREHWCPRKRILPDGELASTGWTGGALGGGRSKVLPPSERTTHMTNNTAGKLLTPETNDGRSAHLEPRTNCSGTAVTTRQTKQALVLSLLQKKGGVPITAIVEATGWLPHTARAALTGLRKKGHAIVRAKIGSETRYTISTATK